MSNYNRPWLTAMTDSQQKSSLDPEARCDEMWSLYAEKLRLLADRLEEGSVSLESLGPKPPYRVNATTRWGLAPSRLPLDMPSDAAAQLMAKTGAKRSGSKSSKRSGSKRPKSKEPPAPPAAAPSAAAPVTVPAPVTVETPVVSAVPAPVPAPLVVPVPAVLEPETSSATESSEAVDSVPPVAAAEVPVEAEMPEASQFSEEDFLKAYQQPERRLGARRARRGPGTVSGRTPKMGTMWMSSTLGGASGIGPDIVSMMRRSSFLRGTFEKINLADQSSLPDLYKAAWPMPKNQKRLALTGQTHGPGARVESRPLSATRAMPALGSRPHSTATRRPKPLLAPTDTRPSSAGTMPVPRTTRDTRSGPKKGPLKRVETNKR